MSTVWEAFAWFSLFICITIALGAWSLRRLAGAKSLMLHSVAVGIWCFFYALSLREQLGDLRLEAHVWRWIGSGFASAWMLRLALRVTLNPSWLHGWLGHLVFWGLPSLQVLLVLFAPRDWVYESVTPYQLDPMFLQGKLSVLFELINLKQVFEYVTGLGLIVWSIRFLPSSERGGLFWVMLIGIVPNLVLNIYALGDPRGYMAALPVSISAVCNLASVALGLYLTRAAQFEHQAIELAFSSFDDAVLILDKEFRLIRVNDAAQRILGLPVPSSYGQSATALFPNWLRIQALLFEENQTYQTLDTVNHATLEYRAYALPNNKGYVVVVRDQSQVASYRQKVRDLMHTDPLTGLENRQSIYTQGAYWLEKAANTGSPCSLLYIDLDDFALVNQWLGTQNADQLLQKVAQNIGKALDKEALIGRLVSDEFVVLLKNTTQARALELQENIEFYVSRPQEVGGHNIRVGCSIGVATFPKDASSIDSLLRGAESQMKIVRKRNQTRSRTSILDFDQINIPV